MLRLGRSPLIKSFQRPKHLSFTRLFSQAAPKIETNSKDFIKMSYKSSSIFVGSGLLLLSYFYYEKGQLEKQREESKNESVGKPLVGGPFTLVDHNGTPVTNLSYKGKYMLIYFGYTFCPDVCPEELEKMAEIVNQVDAGAEKDQVVPIFISCDPKRDSIEAIKQYVKEFHPKFIGLTGTYRQIKKVAKAYRLYFSAPPKALDDDDSDYLVDHSIFFYLIGPNGEFIEHYGRNNTAQEVSEKILNHLKQ